MLSYEAVMEQTSVEARERARELAGSYQHYQTPQEHVACARLLAVLLATGKIACPAPDPAADMRVGWCAAVDRTLARRTGLAPHNPFLYGLTVGLHAQRVFEFGTGESSRVIVGALRVTGGRLHSVAPASRGLILPTTLEAGHWDHHAVLSEAMYPHLPALGPFDLVLHDGSHGADVVAADLAAALPRVKQWGLVLVHDVLHSYVGRAVRTGIDRGVRHALHIGGVATCELTLPFAFGLTIIKVLGNAHLGAVNVRTADKPSSTHHTEGPAPPRGD